ncbi:YhfT family protein [Paludifilum halophilum]|uniref:Uncharacterized protein n=1 Tax=Paludifilum halophilum TaxID=1642702 RepID=A0A235B3K3_9BACL|nr:YhfT family protein [Paludifilum halophilum]OYD06812.1 hypothetical protein CHM34_14765 [Paludifilum halophilum]
MEFSLLKMVLVALSTATTALLSYYGRAVFHDGIRPIMPEFIEGRMKRPELASISFGLSVGFIASVGIAFTLSTQLLNPWLLFLPTDILGVFATRAWLAALLGGTWGVAVVAGISVVHSALTVFPIDFIGALGELSSPVLAGFALFPILAITYQFGWKKGAFSAVIILLVRQMVELNWILPEDIHLLPEAGQLFVGTLLLALFALWKDRGKTSSEKGVHSIFEKRTRRILQGLPFFAVTGALIAAMANLGYFAGSEVSIFTLQKAYSAADPSHTQALIQQAALADFLRGIGFVPLIVTTALTTGVYGVVGLTFIFPIAYLAPNAVFAAIGGALMISLEVLILSKAGKALEKFPSLREASDSIRTAITQVMEIALLLGSTLAVVKMGEFTGFSIFVALYALNEVLGRPVVRLAASPLAAILTGLILNLLYLLQLFTPAAG